MGMWCLNCDKLAADNAERKKIIEFCQKRIAELEAEVRKLGLRCDLLADEKDELIAVINALLDERDEFGRLRVLGEVRKRLEKAMTDSVEK